MDCVILTFCCDCMHNVVCGHPSIVITVVLSDFSIPVCDIDVFHYTAAFVAAFADDGWTLFMHVVNLPSNNESLLVTHSKGVRTFEWCKTLNPSDICRIIELLI